jgi:hypothetical protein
MLYLIGHRGYLGSNLLRSWTSIGIETKTIDTRIDEYLNMNLQPQDLVVDCSRLTTFSVATLKEDATAFTKLQEWVNEAHAQYVRVGSILEVEGQITSSPYIDWCRSRSQRIYEMVSTQKFHVLLFPNIYGGSGSSSVVDLILTENRSGRRVELKEPNAYRDFLSIDQFLKTFHKLTFKDTVQNSKALIITSGTQYKVASLQEYVVTGDESVLVSRKARYNSRFPWFVATDSLPSYLRLG